jgi:hypothetical protein
MSDNPSSILQKLAVAAPPEDASVAEARRERVVPSIERAIARESTAARARARRSRVIAGLALAAAVALAAGVAWRMRAHPSPVAQTTPATKVAPVPTAPAPAAPAVRVESALVAFRGDGELHPGDLVHAGDAVSTRAGGLLTLDLPSGDRVTVMGGARVLIDFLVDGEGISVESGAALVESAGALHIRATGVEVTLRDAATLVVNGGNDVTIVVRRGTIDVRHGGADDVVRAPGKWPSTTKVPPVSSKQSHDVASTLREQNTLLQAALDARRRGDDAAAIASLDRLLARYPRSPLVQDARVERMRAYERSGQHARAVAEAGRYLADFPNGYAREEAKALIVK